MGDKITRAVHKAISEKVIEQLEWDATIGKYVLPEGFIFSIDAPIARIAAKDLGLTLKPRHADILVNESRKATTQVVLESLTGYDGRVIGAILMANESIKTGY